MNASRVHTYAAGLFLFAVAHPVHGQTPMGTAFTYQGQLKSSGVPVNDTCDFEFSLWDAPSGPIQIGSTVSTNGVAVANGLFTVSVDFGSNGFTGYARWLEIDVECSGDAGFTTLNPRQAITPAPYALSALSSPGVFNIMSFGATPNDETDDTAAIEAARDAAVAAGGGVVLVPAGTYQCRNVALRRGVSFVGMGRDASFLQNSGTSAEDDTLTTDSRTYYATIRDLGFRFMANRTQGYAMRFSGLVSSTIEDFYIEAPPGMDEAGGLCLWADQNHPGLPERERGCYFNTIAKGKIYINKVGIELVGQPYDGVNHNYFRDIATHSRESNYIEMYYAWVNVFEALDLENGETYFNPAYDFSLISIDSSPQNIIRNCYMDLGGYGKAFIDIYGTSHWAEGNIIEENYFAGSGTYGIHLGDKTRKNVIKNNTFQASASYDIKVESGGLAVYNVVYDNRFLEGMEVPRVAGRISAPPDTKTLLLWYPEEKDRAEISPRLWTPTIQSDSHDFVPTDTPGSCDMAKSGSVFYSLADNELCFCDGTSWKKVDGGGPCATCGDGNTNGVPEEECDDGNQDNSDACPDGPGGTCQDADCGDGFLWNTNGGSETCDDGNPTGGDGCSPGCVVESGWECTADSPSTCTTVCGDNILNTNGMEECDDGNTAWNDDCGADCRVTSCGDRIIQNASIRAEQCDDGKHCDDGIPPARGTSCTNDSNCVGIGDELCLPRSNDGCSVICKWE